MRIQASRSRQATHRFQVLSKGKTGKRGDRNKTEAEYEATLLSDPNVASVVFEPFSLRLSNPPEGQPARYQPDFLVVMRDGETFVDEVKGTGVDNEASIVRAKCAAEHFPMWTFRLCRKQSKKQGGGFKRRVL